MVAKFIIKKHVIVVETIVNIVKSVSILKFFLRFEKIHHSMLLNGRLCAGTSGFDCRTK